jgi:hypothetical protein
MSKATVKSFDDKECIVKYGTQTAKFKMKKDQVLVLNGELKKIKK